MPRVRKRLLAVLAALVAVLLVLALAYWFGMRHLEGKPRTIWQALQFAAGTMSTTGYGTETQWSHPAMVVFVVIAQFAGVLLIFMVFPIMLIPLLEDRFETRLPDAAPTARDHVVIFDHGPMVTTLIADLASTGIPTVVVEEHEADARHLVARGQAVVHGNLDEGVLGRAGLAVARALVVNSTDDRNAAAILAARQAGFRGVILALVEDPFHRHPMTLAGAAAAFTPRHALAGALAARASRKVSPAVAGIQHLGGRLQVAEVRIPRDSPLAGRPLEVALAGCDAGIAVIGQWVNGRLVAPPAGDMRLEAGGILVVLGSDESLTAFMDLCAGTRRLRREGPFVIAGAGEVGRKVAQLLHDAGEHTRTIDIRPDSGADIVGNVLDATVLRRAGLEDAQAVILALSGDAATLFATVIVADLAPDLPVIARVNGVENVERIYRAGADFALSVSQVAGQQLALHLLGREAVTIDPDLQVVRVSSRGLEAYHPKQSFLREETGCTVVAVERAGVLDVRFAPGFRFAADDVVYVCGDATAVRRFLEAFPQGDAGAVAVGSEAGTRGSAATI